MPLFSRHKDTGFTAPDISELPGRDAMDEIEEPAPQETYDAVWETPAVADEEKGSRRWGFLGSLFRRRKNDDDVAVVIDPVYALPEPQSSHEKPFASPAEPVAAEGSVDAGSDSGEDGPVYQESGRSESPASAEPVTPEGSPDAGSAQNGEGPVSYQEPLYTGSDEDTPDLSPIDDELDASPSAPGLRSVLAQLVNNAAYRTRQFFRRPSATVSIDGDVVRIVIFKGPEVIAWGAAQPEDYGDDEVPDGDELVGLAPAEEAASPERAQDPTVRPSDPEGAPTEEPVLETTEDGPEVRVRTLLKHLGFRRGRVVVDLPLYAPLARRLHLAKIRRGYHNQVVTAEVLESIPFAEHEVDLTWQTRKNGTDEEVHAVAISKEAIDSRVKVLADAGVRPRAAYSKAVALAHAANLRDAIVAHVTPTHASFVLVRGCVAEVIHQIELGARLHNPQRQAEAISRAIESLAGYGHSVDPGIDLESVPVVLVGQLPVDGQLIEELHRTLRRPLSEFSPAIVHPEHFSPAEYATNVGLAMADKAAGKPREKIAADAMPAVNLLPARHLPKPLPVKPAAILGGLLLLAGFALAADGRVDSLTSEAAVLSADLAIIERQERQERLGLARAKKIEDETAAISEKAAAVSGHITSLGNKTRFMLTELEAITHGALHPDVSLMSLKMTSGGFQLVGRGLGYDEVVQYAQTLRELSLFSSVRLHGTSNAENGISFQLDITSAARQ